MYIKNFKFKTKELTFRSFNSNTGKSVLYPVRDCQTKLMNNFINAVRNIQNDLGTPLENLDNNPIIDTTNTTADSSDYSLYTLVFKDVDDSLITKNNLIEYMARAR